MKIPILAIYVAFLSSNVLLGQIRTDSTLQTIELSEQQPEILISPSLSANLIGRNQWEVNVINFLTTRDIRTTRITKRPFVERYDTTVTQSQSTRLEHIIQIQYGLQRNRRLNVGVDIYASHLRTDEEIARSPFRVLGNEAEKSRRGITAFGPRVRWMPFRNIPEFSLQGAVIFGTSNDLTTRQIFGRDRTQLLTQFTFYQRFQPWFYAFVQADVSVLLKNDDFQNNTFSAPLFLYVAANIWGLRSNAYPKIYGLLSWFYASRYDDNTRGEEWLKKRAYESQIGLGILSQLTPRWGVTLWGQKPVSHDLGSVTNEVIPGSWYGLSLGIRYHWIPKTVRQ